MSDQETPEGITIDREYLREDQRGVNVNYEKDGVMIAGRFVVKYYDREADQFVIAVNANRPTGNYIEVGCNVRNAEEAADWLVHISNTVLGGLFQEGSDITNPLHAVLAICHAMIDELERLFEFAKSDDR